MYAGHFVGNEVGGLHFTPFYAYGLGLVVVAAFHKFNWLAPSECRHGIVLGSIVSWLHVVMGFSPGIIGTFIPALRHRSTNS